MTTTGRLANKVAIITGASSGIGRATAFAYHKEGAKIVCGDVRESTRFSGSNEESGNTHDMINLLGGHAIFHKVDMSQPDSVEGLVQAAVKEFGRVDIMVNHAGVAFEGRKCAVWEIPQEIWQSIQDVNSTGVFLGTKFAVQQMLKQDPHPSGDRGWIINTSSILGYVGAPNTAAYSASKGAVLNFTRAAALDCAPHRIHVNGIAPGYTQSAMTGPLWENEAAKAKLLEKHSFRGLGQPEDLAKACVFLASEDAQWITGHTLPVDGGYLAR